MLSPKISDKATSGREVWVYFSIAFGSEVYGRDSMIELGAAGHTASAVRTQRRVNTGAQFAISLLFTLISQYMR